MDRLPSLSFSRCSRKTLRLPSGSTRGTRKQVSPLPGTWARTRKRSHIGAEQNHLCPVSRQLPSPASTARVVLARTSEPPCFSVIPIPASSPALVAAGRSPGSYAVAVSPGSYAAASSGSARSAGTTEYVIDTGQPCPDSTCDQTRKPAARVVCGIGSAGGPRRAGQPVPDRLGEQPVPGRVEVHLVQPVAVPVVGAQHRRRGVGLGPPPLRRLGAGQPAELAQRRRSRRRAGGRCRRARGRRRRRRGRPAAAAGWSPHGSRTPAQCPVPRRPGPSATIRQHCHRRGLVAARRLHLEAPGPAPPGAEPTRARPRPGPPATRRPPAGPSPTSSGRAPARPVSPPRPPVPPRRWPGRAPRRSRAGSGQPAVRGTARARRGPAAARPGRTRPGAGVPASGVR